ncbi:MAG: diguanylate cyclase [Christensenella sp.]|nr:diguanylate cyclase [Christensenella sp.]
MKQDSTTRKLPGDLLRYFGFPLFAVGVVLIAFLGINRQVRSEIQTGTFQTLLDATRYQRSAVEKYVHLVSTRVELIADHESSSAAAALVTALRAELIQDARNVKTGFAGPDGTVIYGDACYTDLSNEDWFLRSMQGETVMAETDQDIRTNQQNIIVSTRANTVGGADGVLFAVLDGQNISGLLDTHAYDDEAYSLICDSKGIVIFSELKPGIVTRNGNIFQWINDQTLEKGTKLALLKNQIREGRAVQYRFSYKGAWYYAVSEKVNAFNWYVLSIVPAVTADVVQQQVSMYLLGMLFIILLVGISMTTQAYLHEQSTIKKLERDKDLLRQSAEQYQLITQLSNEVFFQIDLESGKVSFNDSFEAMFGSPPPLCTIDHLDECLKLFFEMDRQTFLAMVANLRAGAAEAKEDIRMVNARGIIRWKRFEIFSVFDHDGRATQLVGKIADIHRQKQSMQRLIRQADSEPLTGLLNRGAFERNIKGFLEGEGLGGKHALLIMDFDNFKSVNDTLGHAEGDRLLVSFATGMKRLFRAGDYLSRIGGDEYMVFLKNIYEDGDALEKAESLRAEMSGLSKIIRIPVSLSIGIAIYHRDGNSFEALYRAADEALYHVKRNGKNNISFFSVSIHPEELAASDMREMDELDDI